MNSEYNHLIRTDWDAEYLKVFRITINREGEDSTERYEVRTTTLADALNLAAAAYISKHGYGRFYFVGVHEHTEDNNEA